ncbi:MAG: phage major capsid protein [Syntrophobacteraceae bacterium]
MTYPTSTDPDATRAFGTIQYVATGSSGAFDDPDALIDMVYALKAKYRQKARWLFNSVTAATLRKLKDGEGNYLWQRALRGRSAQHASRVSGCRK